MVALITCKNEEDPIENEGARVVTREYAVFSDTQTDNFIVSGWI